MVNDFVSRIPANDLIGLASIVLVILGAVLIAVPAIMFTQMRAVREARILSGLKRDLVARGLPTDEIERLVRARPDSEPVGQGLPTAHEVVVHWQDDWYPAIVLKRAENQWLVHYVGNDTSDNEWVGPDRIRFPLAYFAAEGMIPGELLAANFENHSPRKPEGVGHDL